MVVAFRDESVRMLNRHGLSCIFCYGDPDFAGSTHEEKGWHECHPFVTMRLLPWAVRC
jgi:hypothetical protein